MDLSFDTGGITRRKSCVDCRSKYLSVERFILDRGNAYSVCFIEAHHHDMYPELYITGILGTWTDNDAEDHVTFTCRYGSVKGSDNFACTLIDVPTTFDTPLAGLKLSREEGLKHNKINEFWHLTDFLIESDMVIHDFINHRIKNEIKSRLNMY